MTGSKYTKHIATVRVQGIFFRKLTLKNETDRAAAWNMAEVGRWEVELKLVPACGLEYVLGC